MTTIARPHSPNSVLSLVSAPYTSVSSSLSAIRIISREAPVDESVAAKNTLVAAKIRFVLFVRRDPILLFEQLGSHHRVLRQSTRPG